MAKRNCIWFAVFVAILPCTILGFYADSKPNVIFILMDERDVIFRQTPLERLTSLYTERMVKHIEAFKDKPFFIYFAHNYPHTPYRAGPKFKGSSRDGVRGDVIQEADWGIGEILKSLEANGVLDNTMVILGQGIHKSQSKHRNSTTSRQTFPRRRILRANTPNGFRKWLQWPKQRE